RERRIGGSTTGFGRGRPGRRMLAEDDVVLLGDRHAARVGDLVVNGDESERAAASRLLPNVGNAGFARDRVAYAQRVMEFDLAAGPHPSWQRQRRQELAARCVTVRTDSALPCARGEVQPVPKRWQIVAG